MGSAKIASVADCIFRCPFPTLKAIVELLIVSREFEGGIGLSVAALILG